MYWWSQYGYDLLRCHGLSWVDIFTLHLVSSDLHCISCCSQYGQWLGGCGSGVNDVMIRKIYKTLSAAQNKSHVILIIASFLSHWSNGPCWHQPMMWHWPGVPWWPGAGELSWAPTWCHVQGTCHLPAAHGHFPPAGTGQCSSQAIA